MGGVASPPSAKKRQSRGKEERNVFATASSSHLPFPLLAASLLGAATAESMTENKKEAWRML